MTEEQKSNEKIDIQERYNRCSVNQLATFKVKNMITGKKTKTQ